MVSSRVGITQLGVNSDAIRVLGCSQFMAGNVEALIIIPNQLPSHPLPETIRPYPVKTTSTIAKPGCSLGTADGFGVHPIGSVSRS